MKVPKSIANAIGEVNEVVLVRVEQVSGIEIGVTLLEDVTQDLFVGHLFLAGITVEF